MDAQNLPKYYRAYVQHKLGDHWQLERVQLQSPKQGEILIKIICCGLCYTDIDIAEGHMASRTQWPVTLGHEFVGDVVELGAGVTKWQIGDRVGGAWHSGHDSQCQQCMQGFFQGCVSQSITGLSRPGGFAEFCLFRSEAAVRIPRGSDPVQTAPLLCAGVTVFNSMRHQKIPAGELVAIQGLGGLGHMGIQYANKMGFRVVAISRSSAKREDAKRLGAHHFIDTSKQDGPTELLRLGGAKMIVITAPNPDVIGQYTRSLSWQGKLLLLTAAGNISINSSDLIHRSCSVSGWHAGHARDCEEAVDFASLQGIKCVVEQFPFDKLKDAVDRLKKGEVRFRAVLTIDSANLNP